MRVCDNVDVVESKMLGRRIYSRALHLGSVNLEE